MWEEVCNEAGGGLCIKNLGAFNLALLGKWVWQFSMDEGMYAVAKGLGS